MSIELNWTVVLIAGALILFVVLILQAGKAKEERENAKRRQQEMFDSLPESWKDFVLYCKQILQSNLDRQIMGCLLSSKMRTFNIKPLSVEQAEFVSNECRAGVWYCLNHVNSEFCDIVKKSLAAE